jgi:ABC-type cobalamin transport system permease subunit
MKVEEGRFTSGDNRPSAESEVQLRAYFARKRLIGMRSAFAIFPAAGVLSLCWPQLGIVLVAGGICGVVNMLLIMRNNERLLERGRSRSAYGVSNTARIVLVGLVLVFVAAHGPWWYMLVAIAGMFLPLALYSFELRREISTG